ncbi:MAG: bifunctional 5,10-methylenetetrahydrofolate dehydrogenase/5,10-methenyltetrahydrofolate cyclohydrolase [Fimbriimonadaceae bacterium]|nr:bifunctional 5,10-methylenetetrahydrofolate dehydrogenase/5,10-methenyltetrahydrofolate cyclohydrolase [Fimbriimonadaceae bacterium]
MSEPLILDGLALSKRVRADLKVRVAKLAEVGIVPRLEAIVAAQDPASLAYVRMKRKWAEAAGMESGSWEATADTSMAELRDRIAMLNADPRVHGVLIQHPLPKHLDEDEALLSLGADKDVDGITPASLGRLVADLPGFRCATPLGITRILKEYAVETEGRHAVVIGRSVILGKPVALMLLQMNATVTVAHSRTRDLADLVRTADLVVAAVGRPEMVRGDWLKPEAVVIDAGYNKVEGRSHDVGDVHFDEARAVASAITPVPGGVGPMTVASLLENTVWAAERTLVG